MIIRIFLCPVDILITHAKWHQSTPSDKTQICIAAFLADKVLFALQYSIEHPSDTLDLIAVALSG